MGKSKKPKQPSVRVIKAEDDERARELYRMLGLLITEHHEHLAEAKIALAWRYNWKANADGQLQLAQTRKIDALDRELHHFDFGILLNFEVFEDAEFSAAQVEALLDHELCHCQVKRDEHDDIVRDSAGRPEWRPRKHDIEEFHDVVDRHGCWKREIEQFAKAALEAKDMPLLSAEHRQGAKNAGDRQPAKKRRASA